MNLLEAISSRRSMRAFLDKPVSRKTIEKILTISQRAPSGTNTQPWHTYVCAGDVRDKISAEVIELAKSGKAAKFEDYDYYCPKWNDVQNQRRRELGWELYGLLGIEKGDRKASSRQELKNFEFFGAPVGLFFTVEAYVGRGSWLDAGLYIQTVMLAARAFGLHTCPQAAWIQFQDPIFKHLEIPSDQSLVCGLSIGYADETAIENTLISKREDVTNVTCFHGLD